MVDLDALTERLRLGALAGAGLDVFDSERLPNDHSLMTMRNTMTTPHVAFDSEESIADVQRKAAQNVLDALTGGLPADTVNERAPGQGFRTHHTSIMP